MTATIDDDLARRLATEQLIWLTTVRSDGTPVPTPVWFYWNGDEFVILTQAGSHKLRNIAHNPTVALNFNTDEWGGRVVVFTGAAVVDERPAPPPELPAYLAKYAEGIKMIGLALDSMADQYSSVLRVRPQRVRKME